MHAVSTRAEADAEAKRAALGSVGRVRREGKGGSGPVWRSRASRAMRPRELGQEGGFWAGSGEKEREEEGWLCWAGAGEGKRNWSGRVERVVRELVG